MYISQDPIRLSGGGANFYSYVKNCNTWVDIFGLSGKPKHSPSEAKWLNKGGIIDKSKGDNNWTYTDWEGNTVAYTDGYPDFKNGTDANGNKTFVIQEVDIPDMEGDHYNDYKAAESQPNSKPKSDNTTWHHHQNLKTMQEVDYEIYKRFPHQGGVSKLKKKKNSH